MSEVIDKDGMVIAQRIANAVQKKLVKYTASVKRMDIGDGFVFVEVSIRPPGGSVNDDITVAYTEEFFASATEETLKPKALRVLNDFRTLLGIPRTDR